MGKRLKKRIKFKKDRDAFHTRMFHYLLFKVGLHVSLLTNGRFHKTPVRVKSNRHFATFLNQESRIIMKC